jgi:hypothetical protein
MPFNKRKKDKNVQEKGEGLFKSIFIAYGILILHLVLLAALGLLVLFFRGVVNYLSWIFLGGAAIILGSAYFFIKKLKSEQNTIKEILLLPEFSNKDIEIKLLGGAASFKVESKGPALNSPEMEAAKQLQLENQAGDRIKNLGELSRLYNERMISIDEYERLKSELLSNVPAAKEIPKPEANNRIAHDGVVDIEHSVNDTSDTDSANGEKNE